jgi:sterol desaturase/sphingolipid hydroxylase (fatty acid hydroxylase superfamily)
VEWETQIRLICFFGIFAVMALWELAAPRRSMRVGRGMRWAANIGIVVVDTVLLRIAFPMAAVGFAVFAAQRGWGLFNVLAWPIALEVIVCVVALDFIIYLQHRLFHAVPLFWRLHMVHHADADFDVTLALRFHPIEILLSMVIKFVAVAALGPPALAVLVFEVLLNGMAMFNHSNVRMPRALDGLLRLVLVTPDMHRVHHSVDVRESNSNFGFNLPWWDRICGTYEAQPSEGHEGMTIGLSQYQNHPRQGLGWLLLLPFRGKTGAYALFRRASSGRREE